jgi:hypothetical protein
MTFRSAAAELYALPWELLTVEATGQHIGELAGVLVRYEWPDTETVPPAPRLSTTGRLLLAWSGHVPAAEHQSAIQEACAAGGWSFDPEHDALPDASCGRLSGRLEDATRQGRPIQVLHLLCHGTVTGSAFGFALDDDEAPGRIAAVDAARLRQILAPHAGTLRLVVLAACDGGNVGALGNHLGSVAQGLHRAGIRGGRRVALPAVDLGVQAAGPGAVPRAVQGVGDARAGVPRGAPAPRRGRPAARLGVAPALRAVRRRQRDPARGGAGQPAHPEVKQQLSQFRALFREARNQIALLGHYKAFHDVLQELEVPFNAIERDPPRAGRRARRRGRRRPRPRPRRARAPRRPVSRRRPRGDRQGPRRLTGDTSAPRKPLDGILPCLVVEDDDEPNATCMHAVLAQESTRCDGAPSLAVRAEQGHNMSPASLATALRLPPIARATAWLAPCSLRAAC